MIEHATGCGPVSHGRSHLSRWLESGHGNSVKKVPSTFVSESEYPTSEMAHGDPTVPTKGEEEPPAADSVTVSNAVEPLHDTLTCAVTLVPEAGAAT